ncbi:DUF4468 domain-containing protein [Spirosoma sp.]|uniref:DUF4468 domain-containing protein n=1 Tax=Spirosoma sp. TaxID=1899569 RepID=UPI003B3A8204
MFTTLLALLLTSPLLLGSVYGSSPPDIMSGGLHGILPVVNQKVTYSEVIDCGSVSQSDLFRRARLWVVQSGHASNELFALSDKETGDLAGRFVQTVVLPRSETSAGGIYTFRYSYLIECANRKYRATLTQIEVDEGNGRFSPIETYRQKNEKDLQAMSQELDRQLKNVLTSLQESVKNYKSF